MRAVMLFIMWTLIPLGLVAQTDDQAMFMVNDVAVDITAANAAAARDQAILKAQHNALAQLLTRLGADPAPATKLSDDALAGLVQGFEIQQERTSAVRYIATLTVQFKPNAIRQMLGQTSSKAVLTPAHPVVIVPITVDDKRVVLFEDNTPWRQAWEAVAQSGGLLPLIVPSGDLEDIAALDGRDALAGKFPDLPATINKYHAGQLTVAAIYLPIEPEGQARVSLQTYAADGTIEYVKEMMVNSAPALFHDAVKQARQMLEEEYRSANVLPSGPTAFLPVFVPISDLGKWSSLRTKLAAISLVKQTTLLALARSQANIELEFYGNLPQLQNALLRQDLVLQPAINQNGWQLTSR